MASWASGQSTPPPPHLTLTSPGAGTTSSPSDAITSATASPSTTDDEDDDVDDDDEYTPRTNMESLPNPGESTAVSRPSEGSTSPRLEKRPTARRAVSHPYPSRQHPPTEHAGHLALPSQTEPPNPQLQLSDYRQKLAREMSARVNSQTPSPLSPFGKRPSPIEEEKAAATESPSLSKASTAAPTMTPTAFPTTASTATTASNGSTRTVRTHDTGKSFTALTPSYPFPRMTKTGHLPAVPAAAAWSMHKRAQRSRSKTDSPGLELRPGDIPPSSLRSDQLLSSPSTPGSAAAFVPRSAFGGMQESQTMASEGPGNRHAFPSPNLYELALALSSEPGLDPWWSTVVQIATECYQAERVALAIPADSTDVENMPWGQKATFNAHEKDDGLSLGYMERSDSLGPDGVPLSSAPPLHRPDLTSRYSYSAFEKHREQAADAGPTQTASARPSLTRRKTSQPFSTRPRTELLSAKASSNLDAAALEEHDADEPHEPTAEFMGSSLHSPLEARARVLPVLQALDYETDPLIDHNGVQRVLDRGSVVALTRSYPYVAAGQHTPHADTDDKAQAKPASTSTPAPTDKLSLPLSSSGLPLLKSGGGRPSASFLRRLTSTTAASSRLEESSSPYSESPPYEEYEQLPPSPWSQSPAPSPAIRPESFNYFSAAVVDEGSFSPGMSPEEYKETSPPDAIGYDNAWTVLHIPLYHPQPLKTSQWDKAKMAQKASPLHVPGHEADGSPNVLPSRPKRMPIAILSILSPVIPYPSNLRHSLEHIAPHMATSLSLCIHYSNLEAEVNGLTHRRHDLGGFGGIDTEGHPLPAPSTFATTPYLTTEDPQQQSHAGSMTSFSDYSTRSRSIAGSPGGTPGWDAVALTTFLERHSTAANGLSPGNASLAGDGYFGMRTSGALGRPVTTPGSSSGAGGASISRGRKNSVTQSSTHSEKRHDTNTNSTLTPLATARADDADRASTADATEPLAENNAGAADPKRDAMIVFNNERGFSLGDRPLVASPMPPTPGGTYHVSRHSRVPSQFGQVYSGHSLLHSYGADFASTFPSLPSNGTIAVKGAGATMQPSLSTPSRAASVAASVTPSNANTNTNANAVDMPPPSDRLKSLILDSLPAHVFVAMPQTGAIVWVNSRYLAYRGQTVEGLAEDPWGSLHPDDREEYLKAWSHSVRTGDQFSRTVRIRRFDGSYRWFQARAVASRDRRNSIMQFLGSYMDIHDQYIAELKAARQEEIEASETKHRFLANLIPQIIFTANEEEGVTFANEQWLSYTGQKVEDLVGLGFLDNVHPYDLAKCSFIPVPAHLKERRARMVRSLASPTAMRAMDSLGDRVPRRAARATAVTEDGEEELSELALLARRGIILVTTDDNGRPSYTTEVRLRSKSGDYRWHLVRCVETGTMDFGKGYNSYFGSATDINDHKLLEDKLKEAMDSKTRFLSNMSHEIRTPLIGISGMVSFLQDTTLNEEQRDYTNTIQTSANSLLMIINDILDLSKVDAGMMKLSFEWFHTRSLIEDVNELVSAMAIAKGLELNYIVDADVPSWVKGDRVRMRQVLLNVIGNAIKFTTEGEVFSRCRVVPATETATATSATATSATAATATAAAAAAADEDKLVLEFSIMDTGRGFSKEEAELIFKPFSQIDGSSTRQHGGSGLGLVISRQLVELHGGKMNGSAVPGKGSIFTFTAVFGLPTETDHPDGLATPTQDRHAAMHGAMSALGFPPTPVLASTTTVVGAAAVSASGGSSAHPLKRSTTDTASGASGTGTATTTGTSTGTGTGASGRPLSASDRSFSMSALHTSDLSRFGEAARTSGQDLSRIVFSNARGQDQDQDQQTVPPRPPSSKAAASSSSDTTKTAKKSADPLAILIVCPQMHSREATAKHIEMTLPAGRPYKITATATIAEVLQLIAGGEQTPFTHVVINLPSPQEILELVDQLDRAPGLFATATILLLSDLVQRQAVNRLVAGTRYEALLSDARAMYIYKPVKPSRFAVIFDPERESDISIDRNRSSARQLVETEKKSYVDLEQRMGNKGHRVLLVEDNMLNQKVLTMYLRKVGVDVDLATDGVECTDTVLSRPHGYYSLILCDLHMPRKDGYQACREIRAWEARGAGDERPLPIIALSANVMSDVQDKCVEAGFNRYLTKPVDFIELSHVLTEFF